MTALEHNIETVYMKTRKFLILVISLFFLQCSSYRNKRLYKAVHYDSIIYDENEQDRQLKRVLSLLERGADPNFDYFENSVLAGNDTLLGYAAKKGKTEIAAALLKHGANPNQEYLRKPPVLYALEQNNVILVKLLVSYGADVKPFLPEAQAESPPDMPPREEPTSQTLPQFDWVYSRPAELFFSRSEVTVSDYKQCVSAGACNDSNHKTKEDDDNCNWGYSDRDNHPINCVNWDGANDFCTWVGGRLPTRNEWYAEASNSGERNWPWGNNSEVDCSFAICAIGNDSDGCGKGHTWPVCSKPKGNSVSGLCDMTGNVWEWTSTKLQKPGIERDIYVLQGGAWFDKESAHLKASFSLGGAPEFWFMYYSGFRCVQ